MRLLGAMLFLALLSGCSTALDREGRCLAGMVPEVLRAEEEVWSLEESWRMLSRAQQQKDHSYSQTTFVAPTAYRSLPVTSHNPLAPSTNLGVLSAERDEQAAYSRLVEAKAKRHETFAWYDRVAHRLQTRMEEDDMLSQARTVLITWPGIVFYPIVRWNVRSVLWDGIDPDADTDPVTRFCAGRLLALEETSLPVD